MLSDSSDLGGDRCDRCDFEGETTLMYRRGHVWGRFCPSCHDAIAEFAREPGYSLATEFNESHGCTLYEQTIKMQEEAGEVSEAVLGYSGDLLFKDSLDADDVGGELADLVTTAHYVAALSGVDDLDARVRDRLQSNLSRIDRSVGPATDRHDGEEDCR